MRTKDLFDIFSRKKTKKKDEMWKKITVDYREKNSLVISELVSMGFEINFKELKVADYLVKGVAIERKTVSDFISSIKNKRMTSQLEEIQQYKDRLLIIEGMDEQELYSDDFSGERIGMHPNAIRGFLLSVILKYKVPIIFTKNSEDTAKFILVLSKKENKEAPLNVSKKNLTKKERKQFILESFSNIGPKTAKKLLKKFRTIRSIINASQEEIRESIGKKSESFKVVEEEY